MGAGAGVFVSFVIPLYNCLELTRACVASLQQTLPAGLAHEIILVDDGSTDGTRSWLTTLGEPFRVILNDRNLGYAAANNRGATLARGKFLALLNSDLVLTAGWLAPLLAAHARLGNRAGLIGNVQRAVRDGAVDHAGIFINPKGKPEHERVLPARAWVPGPWTVREMPAVTGACVLVRRSLYAELGGFSEDYVNGCEDVDFCFRAARAGFVNAVALRSIVLHHVSASPGRKRRDEENTYRLTLRWRDTLAQHAARPWCAHYLQTHWHGPTANPDFVSARAALAYLLHLRRSTPPDALTGMRAAIDHELSRWRALFPGDSAFTPPDSPESPRA